MCSNSVGPQVHQHAAHALPFDLEHPHHVAARQQLVDLRVVDGQVVSVYSMPWRSLIRRTVSRIRRQGRQAQEVDLEQPDRFEDRVLILRDLLGDRRLRRAHQRRVVDERPVGHDHGRGMDRGMASHPLQLAGGVEQVLDVVLALVQLHAGRPSRTRGPRSALP